LPPLNEQEQICRWIKDELQPIYASIERAQREINLIREYHTRLIADVVTGKVDVRNVKCEERRVKEGDEDRWDEIGDTGDNEGLIDAESNIGETDKEVEEV
jgi:type I restriction enzyme, S subunit